MKAEKKRFAVTAADLVIFILILLVGLFIYRYAFAGSAEDTFEIDYVVKVSAIRNELSDRIAVGDAVYSSNGDYMGRVSAYQVRAAVLETTGQTLPDCSDLYITIEAQASGSGNVSGYEIYAERELEMYTTGLSFHGVCIRVRR